MRVLVDTSCAARGPSGTAVYVERLVAALREREAVDVVEARQRVRLRPGREGARRSLARSAANAVLDAVWLHAGLARAARRCGAAVVHHPLPAHSRLIAVPQVSTLHDVAFLRLPGLYDPAWRRVAAHTYRRAARRCEALVCVSEATARDAVALLDAARERTVVAPHGPGQVPGGAPGARPDGDHLLFVGDAEPRKNLDGLLAAYSDYRASCARPVDLVLAGAAERAAGEPGVRAKRGPGTDELLALLRAAVALVHPSLHEGFGLTLLEAMALGVPVVAVRNAGTEEVCGDAALLVSAAGLAEGLARVAADAELRAELARRGRERAAGFSWSEAARRHELAYTLAVGGPAARPDTQ